MRIELIVLVILAIAVTAIGLIHTASTIEKKTVPQKDRLQWYAKEAKAERRDKVRVPAPLIEYLGGAGTITADEAFASSTVVVAHLVSKESFVVDDEIRTWNKFGIDEVLSEAKELPCPACVPPQPPASQLPLKSGEFLITKSGGTVNIDGVEVEQLNEAFPEYEFHQQYLLLLNLYPAGTARTVGGPVGVFRVLPNNKIVPVHESEHRIPKDLKERFGNSLDEIRKALTSLPRAA
jgi:hypothetical protein